MVRSAGPDGRLKAAFFNGLLGPGSALVLYTDGITEAFNPQHEQFGEERLKAATEIHASAGAAAVCDGIVAALNAHRGSMELADDTTLVILRALTEA